MRAPRRLLSVSLDKMRNFCIIAHIDHGKSTLADAMLRVTGGLGRNSVPQVLDSLEVERNRGITIKAQTATMDHKGHMLNLIDTPGHCDFSFETNRSVAACEGGLLLVDSSQGIEAQTLANYRVARQEGIKLLPVLTKIDLGHAQPELVKEQLFMVLDIDPDEVVLTSAKSGQGVDELLDRIIADFPAPSIGSESFFKAYVLDSWYDVHRGVILVIKVSQGQVKAGQRISALLSKFSYEIQEVGLLRPYMSRESELYSGQVGYAIMGIRTTKEVILGDTLCIESKAEECTPYKALAQSKSMVFASIYPADSTDFDTVRTAVDKLLLTDASVHVQTENSEALGFGFRCGFSGVLHMEVFCERLKSEFGVEVVLTAPSVPYRMYFMEEEGEVMKEIQSPVDWNPSYIRVEEPIVEATVICPDEFIGSMHELCAQHRGLINGMEYLGDKQIMLKYRLPLSEVVISFFDQVKSTTSGKASIDLVDAGFEEADLVKLTMLINGTPVEPLSMVCDRKQAPHAGRTVAVKLKREIPRQNYEIVIQASVGSKVIARERIPPYRKDVLTKSGKTVGGGDQSRKKKLLEKQKEGKKRMKSVGNVSIPQEAFFSVLKLK